MTGIAKAISAVLIAAVTATGGILIGSNQSEKAPEETPKENITSEQPAQEIPKEDADGVFAIAVIPDTQQEVVNTRAIENKHFLNRTNWLVDNKKALDLRCVVHTGDIVNWGNEVPEQFVIASEAMEVLADANIPTALCLGNHDTAAVGVGGSAADPANTRTRVRDTDSFNAHFSLDTYDYLVPYIDGKIDNAYLRFEACGTKWLVIALELCPRDDVIAWAESEIKLRPDYNVIIATHAYLNSDGSIQQNNGGYGANSPQYMYDKLIKKYENIKIVLSGHTGSSLVREDIGEHGNKIVSLLGCFHSNDQNPVKTVNIDVANGKIYGNVFSPINQDRWEQFDFEVDGLEFIKYE